MSFSYHSGFCCRYYDTFSEGRLLSDIFLRIRLRLCKESYLRKETKNLCGVTLAAIEYNTKYFGAEYLSDVNCECSVLIATRVSKACTFQLHRNPPNRSAFPSRLLPRDGAVRFQPLARASAHSGNRNRSVGYSSLVPV